MKATILSLLHPEELQILKNETSPETCAELAKNLASRYDKTHLSSSEQGNLVNHIFRVLACEEWNTDNAEKEKKEEKTPLVQSGEINTKMTIKPISLDKIFHNQEIFVKTLYDIIQIDGEEATRKSDELYIVFFLHSLCAASPTFFAKSFARYAHIPFDYAQSLLEKEGEKGFHYLYKNAELPPNMLEACWFVYALRKTIRESGEKDNGPLLLERIVSTPHHESIPHINYCLNIISSHVSRNKETGS